MEGADNQLYLVLGAAESAVGVWISSCLPSKPVRVVTPGFWEVEPAVPAMEGVWLGVVLAGWVGDLPVLLTGDMTSKTYFWPLPNTFPFSF